MMGLNCPIKAEVRRGSQALCSITPPRSYEPSVRSRKPYCSAQPTPVGPFSSLPVRPIDMIT